MVQVDKTLIKRELFVVFCAVLACVLAFFWAFQMPYYWNYTTLGNSRHPSLDARSISMLLSGNAWLAAKLFLFAGPLWVLLRRKFAQSFAKIDRFCIFTILGIVTTLVFTLGNLFGGFLFAERWRAPDFARIAVYIILLGVVWGAVCWKLDNSGSEKKRPVVANLLGMILVTNICMASWPRSGSNTEVLTFAAPALVASVALFFCRPTGRLLSKIGAVATILLSIPILFGALQMWQFTFWPDTFWVGTLPAVAGLFAISIAIRAVAAPRSISQIESEVMA